MPLDSNSINKFRVNVAPEVASKWAQRRDIPIAILAWIGLGIVVLWALGWVIRTILVIVVATLLAFALAPAVKLLSRFIPRIIAILIVYLVVLGAISLLLYFVATTAIDQVSTLAKSLIGNNGANPLTPIIAFVRRFGVTQAQINQVGQQIANQAEGVVGSAVPVLTGIFNFILDIIIVAVLSIYLLSDGERVVRWVRRNVPLIQRERTIFLLDTFNRVIGGYIRGQVTLCLLIGFLVGIGMFILHVPYAVLLGVLAFVLEFIPVLGTLTSGAICVLIALTQGWIIAVLVLAYFIFVHIIEGEVVGPRIVGKAVGLHPAVALIALIAGAELFGIWGAVLASPIAGVLQALLIAIYQDWRTTHPDQFPTGGNSPVKEIATEMADAVTHEKQVPTGKSTSEEAGNDPSDAATSERHKIG
ncbi:MAG TPA: AI-2E family transporter [Ktedonobacteraceae bacterium]|nr:AI-2E family transporter [Ktedonobacteraceae bacterium]